MTPEHTDMTGAARLREALDVLLEALERVDISGQVGDVEDLDAAIHDGCEALAAVPEAPEPVYEWRAVNRHGLSVGFCVNESHAREWLQENPPGHIERRTPGTAPGPWERVEEGTER